MEIKIGILENDKIYADSLIKLLNQWAAENSSAISIEVYSKGEDLLNRNISDYNILFIDIHLDGINGVEVAQILRQKNYYGEIVFLTAYSEYVFDGYEVQALNYILKPISYERLQKCMDIVMKSIQNNHYTFRNRDIVEQIPFNDILYIASSRHHMEIITAQKISRHLISIKDILKQLPSPFIQCHRTLIINIDHVQKLEGTNVIMSNKVSLPVSTTYLEQVRKKLESLVF